MILVTGGTGFVGAHLLAKLATKEQLIRATYRNKQSIEKTKRLFETKEIMHLWENISWCKADVTDLSELTKAFEDITEVYHCAAMVSFQDKDIEKMSKINIEATSHMVNLSLAFNVSKFCYVSSIATLDQINKESNSFDETSEWNANQKHSDYAITKNGGEIEVWRAMQEGLPAVIVNPGVIFGHGFENQSSGVMVSKIKKGMPFYTKGLMAIVHIDDVIEAMLFLMNRNHFYQRYVLVAENLSIQHIFSSLAIKLNKKPPHIEVGKKLLLGLAVIDRIITPIIPNKKRSLTSDLVQTSFSKNVYDSSKYLKLSKKSFLTFDQMLHLL